tara:strand:+ start:3367 stop:3627 length:261 start_codon:yes stop_codon:yes gene_type:complete
MEQSAITAALIGVILCLTKFIEKVAAKKTNGNEKSSMVGVNHALKEIEEDLKETNGSLADFKRAFFEFREESRIHRATEKAAHRED